MLEFKVKQWIQTKIMDKTVEITISQSKHSIRKFLEKCQNTYLHYMIDEKNIKKSQFLPRKKKPISSIIHQQKN